MQPLLDAQGTGGTPLAEAVKRNLDHLWSTGGRLGSTGTGRRPSMITLRFGMLHGEDRAVEDHQPPPLARLIDGRGLALKLELLMIFDAHCRHAPGAPVHNPRRVRATADDEYTGWVDHILTAANPRPGSGHGPVALRVRQVTSAMAKLEALDLLEAPRTRGTGYDTRFDHARLLSEESLPNRPSYRVSNKPGEVARVHSTLFTNLWIFALTDAEIALYLMLCALRTRFPDQHRDGGIFVTTEARQDSSRFGLSDAVYRSHQMLLRFGLIERLEDPERDFNTGKHRNFRIAWRNQEVQPHRFRIIDEGLESLALPVIEQKLRNPTLMDHARMQGLLAPSRSGGADGDQSATIAEEGRAAPGTPHPAREAPAGRPGANH